MMENGKREKYQLRCMIYCIFYELAIISEKQLGLVENEEEGYGRD